MARANPSPMRRIFQRKGSQENGAPVRGLSFSWPVLLLLGLALLCAVIWAFVMGFMVGRGHNPEAHIREMAGLAKADAAKPASPDASAEIPEMAPPADEAESQPIASASPEKASGGPRFPEPSEAALAAWGESWQDKPKPASTPPVKTPERKAAPDNAPQYDFTYQLAALKMEADAQKMQKKLRAQSIKAQIRKSGKVYLLLASFRGSARTEQDMLAKIRAAGLGKPLRLSQKEAPQKATQKTRGKK